MLVNSTLSGSCAAGRAHGTITKLLCLRSSELYSASVAPVPKSASFAIAAGLPASSRVTKASRPSVVSVYSPSVSSHSIFCVHFPSRNHRGKAAETGRNLPKLSPELNSSLNQGPNTTMTMYSWPFSCFSHIRSLTSPEMKPSAPKLGSRRNSRGAGHPGVAVKRPRPIEPPISEGLTTEAWRPGWGSGTPKKHSMGGAISRKHPPRAAFASVPAISLANSAYPPSSRGRHTGRNAHAASQVKRMFSNIDNFGSQEGPTHPSADAKRAIQWRPRRNSPSTPSSVPANAVSVLKPIATNSKDGVPALPSSSHADRSRSVASCINSKTHGACSAKHLGLSAAAAP
mmetsp:Transcript_80521/g.260840  ORF Transcript_80521/g.260840 Transcript_80521/m.260840 type:complete len:343 (+) Transcript_80521:192-1220(+)